jgi:glutathione S-transferase
MSELILHHYPTSPFSEKVRAALGFKRLAWRSVEIPVIMPKPDLMPLTGGYRRTPVMQTGADIWCDSQIILREIERRHPRPSLLPPGHEGAAQALAFWADRNVFWTSVGVVIGEIAESMPAAFHTDRAAFSGRPFDPSRLKAAQPVARDQLHAQLAWAEAMLADGRSFLLGATPTLADFALYNPVWFVRARLGPQTPPLDRVPLLSRWAERMASIGTGTPSPMTAAEALDVARDAVPAPARGVDPQDPSGLEVGQPVSVTPDDTGKVPVVGSLVTLSAEEVAVRRHDPLVGDLVVHFPRAGFVVAAA